MVKQYNSNCRYEISFYVQSPSLSSFISLPHPKVLCSHSTDSAGGESRTHSTSQPTRSMPKRKAEIEAGSSDHPNKVAKLTQDELPQDQEEQGAYSGPTTTNDQTSTGLEMDPTVTTSLDDTAPNSQHGGSTPNSPPGSSNSDSKKEIIGTDQDTTAESKSKKPAKKTPVKSAKSTSTKQPRKPRSKKAAVIEPTTPPPPKPKRINKIVRAKVESILDFVNTTDPSDTVLERSDTETPSLITITKSHLISTLMSLRADYELGDPMWADLSTDIPEAVVRTFSAPNGTWNVETEWVVVDVSIKTDIEKQVEVKVEGWGLEDVRLLEVEMEVVGREIETGAGWRLCEEVEMATNPSGSSQGGEEHGVVVEGKEVERIGVCPAPKKEVL